MTAAGRRALVAALALAACVLALWQLERARSGIERVVFTLGETPATLWSRPGTDGPLVVLAHGFAGSRQMMQGYALTLARAGYRALAFDFEGHGRNPVPMSGDVTRLDGTTERLIRQTLAVIDAGLARTEAQPPVALLGHSMATDILIRTSLREARAGPVVAISMFSQAVTPERPERLLMISGAWEGRLREVALDAVRMIDPDAGEGETVTAAETRRRAVVAPGVEHVGVLFSATAMRETLDWLDAAYGRDGTGRVAATGGWLVLLLGAIVALAWPLSRLLPGEAPARSAPLTRRRLALALALPALAAPPLAVVVGPGLLPAPVVDHLAVHLLAYGGLQLALLTFWGWRPGPLRLTAALALAVWGIAVFGLALDRYAANFMPTSGRLVLIAGLVPGCLVFMVADAAVTGGGQAGLSRRLAARGAFLVSLGLAVALDFERLFFLLIIAPVIVAFFLVFGLMGRWTAERSGGTAAGAGLGLILAWALGVSFPLVALAN